MMKLKPLGSVLIVMLVLMACSEPGSVETTTKTEKATALAGKPNAPIYLNADLPKQSTLGEAIDIPIDLQVPPGGAADLQFNLDNGLELLEPNSQQLHLAANDSGQYSITITVRPTLVERLYLRVYVTAENKGRSFSLPIAVEGASAKTQTKLQVQNDSGENIIVLPAQER